MLFHYFTIQKMNYQADLLDNAVLMEDVSVDRHDAIERDYLFYFQKDISYCEMPFLLTPSDYADLTSLIQGSSPYKHFRGHGKEYWEKLLKDASHKTVSL